MQDSDKWQVVDEKIKEMRKLVVEKWDKGEWRLAALGLSTIKTVEQSKANAEEMKKKTDDYIKTVKTVWPKHHQHE